MMTKLLLGVLATPLSIALTTCVATDYDSHAMPDDPSAWAQSPADDADDEAYAKELWQAIQGYHGWKLASGLYPGRQPHGSVLRIYSTWVDIDGKSHPVIVKDNYSGEQKVVEQAPEEHLAAVSVMLHRPGYDPEHGGWFWAQYQPDGSLAEGEKGNALAGAVPGCVRCHSKAGGDDYLFHNDG